MILKSIILTASPDLQPTDVAIFTWKLGDDLHDLIACNVALGHYIAARQDQLRTALASQQPIEAS